jgi:hypothetical protein
VSTDAAGFSGFFGTTAAGLVPKWEEGEGPADGFGRTPGGPPMSGLTYCRKLFLFTALSLIDLALTWIVLGRAEGRAFESNLVAAWWLDCFGWPGLTGFKVAIVLLVAALTLMVSRHRPRVGGCLLTFGCSALLAVVVYSVSLVRRVEAEAGSAVATALRQAQEAIRNLERDLANKRAYDALLGRLVDDLLEHRRTLTEAVEALAEAEYVKDPDWLRRMQLSLPGRGKDECLAGRLVFYTLDLLQADPYRSERVYRDLDATFRSSFGRPAPCRRGGPIQPPVESVLGGTGPL